MGYQNGKKVTIIPVLNYAIKHYAMKANGGMEV
jgi:hypothetical protein